MARRPNRARSERRSGAIDPIPPIWIAMDEKLANPHSAYVKITALRPEIGSLEPKLPATFKKATNSLVTVLTPS